MVEIISLLLPYIAPTAIPIVVVVIACFFIYTKNKVNLVQMKNENETMIDKESQEIRDICKENALEIRHLKEDLSSKNEILDTLRSQVNELNVNLAIVSERIVTLVDVIKELKK